MKRLLTFLVITTSFSFMFANLAVVRAVSITEEACKNAPDSAFCKDEATKDNPLFGPTGIITRITQFANVVAGVIAVFVVTIGGLKYVMSSGDPQKLTSARNTILYGAIGIVVVVIAQSIVLFILKNI